MDGPEARGGECEEHGGMVSDRVIDALAADEPGSDQVAGIGPVGVGTGRTAGLAPRATGLQEHTIGQGVRGEAKGPVRPLSFGDRSSNTDRVPAPVTALARIEEVLPPARIELREQGFQ